MRWHVQGVGRIGRNLRVALRRNQRPACQRWHVVGMDDVVGQPGMGRLLFEQFLEDRPRLEPPGVGFIRGIFGRCDRQRVEDLRLMVLWILLRDFAHGIAIGEQARALWRVLEAGVQLADGG